MIIKDLKEKKSVQNNHRVHNNIFILSGWDLSAFFLTIDYSTSIYIFNLSALFILLRGTT